MIQTVLVTGSFPLPDSSAPPPGSRIVFRLTGFDTDGDLIVPGEVIANFSPSGEISVQLWPNSRGTRGTKYKVTLYLGNGKNNAYELGLIEVPTVGPVTLVALIDDGVGEPETEWLLDGGSWSDAGAWDDTSTWTEAA